jgi:Lrp/AsnC family leucine-responsive transcriptional regulator
LSANSENTGHSVDKSEKSHYIGKVQDNQEGRMDAIDRKLLRLLQQDGRQTHAALAQAVGLSRPSVIERLRKLKKSGIIRGYTVVLNPSALGREVTAFVAGRFRGGTISSEEEKSLMALRDEPDILECHNVAGEESIIMKIVTSSIESLEDILTRIRNRNVIFSTTTSIVLSTYYDKRQVQI